MALPNNNITTGMVRNELGENTNNVGELCTSNKIHKWSPNKPYSLIAPADAENKPYPPVNGLWRLTNGDVIYKKPSGGASDPYRLGDFRGYNKSAAPPCWAEVEGSPTIVEGDIEWITIRIHTGAINPTSITGRTNPIKRTMGEGPGGIAIAERGKSVGSIVSSDDVFSADSTAHVVRINSELFDLYYVERTIEGEYVIVGGTKPYLIEDLSYRDAISVEPFGVEFGNVGFLWVDYGNPVGPSLRLTVQLTNTTTSERTFTVTTTATLTNATGSHNVSPSPEVITLEGGENISYVAILPTGSVTQGSNTVSGNFKLTRNGIEVGYKAFLETFTASTPL